MHVKIVVVELLVESLNEVFMSYMKGLGLSVIFGVALGLVGGALNLPVGFVMLAAIAIGIFIGGVLVDD